MAKEIERKFLIDLNKVGKLISGVRISQGYVNTCDRTVVRVRVKADSAFLTLKGEIRGMTCSEFEYEIPVEDAKAIIQELCSGATVDKTRYEILHEGHRWEIDIFHGDNDGLVVAEVELTHESEPVKIPSWVIQEVTGQANYFNSSLLLHPYKIWKH